VRGRELVDNLAAALAKDEGMCRQNRCAWPRSHRGDRFERFRTSKQTGRNPPQAARRLRTPPGGQSHHLRTHPKRDRGFGAPRVQRALCRPHLRRDRYMQRVTHPQPQPGLIGEPTNILGKRDICSTRLIAPTADSGSAR
jgi:hypothetical protein